MTEKKPPLEEPLMMEKMIRGAKLFETGQMASIDTPLSASVSASEFKAPRLSHI